MSYSLNNLLCKSFSFKCRNYDYALGRFLSVDPLAKEYSYQSPYAFSENRVVDSRELEGLERVWFGNALPKEFKTSYQIQRKTSDGIEFQKILKNQNKINLLYLPKGKRDFASGRTIPVSNKKEFDYNIGKYGLKIDKGEYFKLTEGDKKDLIIITVSANYFENFKSVDGENLLLSNTAALNHEEVAHTQNRLLGIEKNPEEEHSDYYGQPTGTISPNDCEVLTNDKYKSSKARENLEEIQYEIQELNELDEEK